MFTVLSNARNLNLYLAAALAIEIVVLLTFAVAPAISAPLTSSNPATSLSEAGSDYYQHHLLQVQGWVGRVGHPWCLSINRTQTCYSHERKTIELTARVILQQGKICRVCKHVDDPFVFATNGHLFMMYDHFACTTSKLWSLIHFR
jgi:hypothetical protein